MEYDVSADKLREQTYTKEGKMSGSLKGLTMSGNQIAIWMESYSICPHVMP